MIIVHDFRIIVIAVELFATDTATYQVPAANGAAAAATPADAPADADDNNVNIGFNPFMNGNANLDDDAAAPPATPADPNMPGNDDANVQNAHLNIGADHDEDVEAIIRGANAVQVDHPVDGEVLLLFMCMRDDEAEGKNAIA
jgi:hypothetical protein